MKCSGKRPAACLVLLIISAAMILPPGLLPGPGQDSFADSGRSLLVKAAAPEDVERLPEGRCSSPANGKPAPHSAFHHADPLAEAAGFLRLCAPSSMGDHDGRAAFTRLIVRILSPSSRLSWG